LDWIVKVGHAYGNCLILTGILDIFQPITACIVKPLKNSALDWHIKLKLDYYIPMQIYITEKIKNMKVAIVANLRLRKSIGRIRRLSYRNGNFRYISTDNCIEKS
jgi:hypothetical protein